MDCGIGTITGKSGGFTSFFFMRSTMTVVCSGDGNGEVVVAGTDCRRRQRRGGHDVNILFCRCRCCGRNVCRRGRRNGWQIVREAVPTEIAVPTKHLAARRTVVRFDVGVCQQVRLQIGTLVKAPAAHRTLVRGLL